MPNDDEVRDDDEDVDDEENNEVSNQRLNVMAECFITNSGRF